MHVYFIRHGESYVNLPDWNGGNQDTGLTPKGNAQARALGAWLKQHIRQPDALYASTMLRARETVAYVQAAYGLPVLFDDRLREIGNNRFDHTPWDGAALPEYADYWASARPFASLTPTTPGGESMMHFRTRVGLFLDDILACHPVDGAVMAVCHGFVIDMVFDIAFNVGAKRHCEVWSGNTGITHFEHVDLPGRETWRLRCQNRIEHLINLPLDGLLEAPADAPVVTDAA
jgi:broad specificity phosphatase PhoE